VFGKTTCFARQFNLFRSSNQLVLPTKTSCFHFAFQDGIKCLRIWAFAHGVMLWFFGLRDLMRKKKHYKPYKTFLPWVKWQRVDKKLGTIIRYA